MIIDYFIDNWVEIVGALFGILYLYFEYKADMKMWPTGIIMSLFYTYVYVHAQFYAFAIINIYFIIAGIYGWVRWKKSSNDRTKDIELRYCPSRLFIPITIALILIYCLLVLCLNFLTNSKVSYADSFITTLSIVAMWMLAQRYVEQWVLLIVLNTVSIFIYLQQSLYATTLMYLIYAIVSYFGFVKWKKSINKNNEIT